MPASTRTVSLTTHQQEFLDAQVAAGRHASTSEVVREALRRYEDDVRREDAHLAYIRRLAEHGEAEMARGDYDAVATEDLGRYLGSLGRE
jgi:antitoxin ParD1/3/4